MIKKILCSVLIILLYGCGASLSNKKTQNFTFDGKTWDLTIPDNWEILPPQAETLFMARKKDQNFVILKRKSENNNLTKQIIESAQRDFFFFELISESASSLIFKGQVRAALPTRIFEQKFYTEGETLLLGSCSYEIPNTNKVECQKILKSWKLREEEK